MIEENRQRKEYFPFFNIGKELAFAAKKTVPVMNEENFNFILRNYDNLAKQWCKEVGKKYNQWHMDHFGSSTGFGMKCNVDLEVIEYEHVFDPLFQPIVDSIEDPHQREIYIRSTWNVIKYLCVKWQVVKD